MTGRRSALSLGPSTYIGGRFAAWVLQNLDRQRVRNREPDDEIDATLADLAALAAAWTNGQRPEGSHLAALPSRPLTTQDVAAAHGVHEASVRRAIREGRLSAVPGRHGWQITPAAAQEWRPRKARTTDRAA